MVQLKVTDCLNQGLLYDMHIDHTLNVSQTFINLHLNINSIKTAYYYTYFIFFYFSIFLVKTFMEKQ